MAESYVRLRVAIVMSTLSAVMLQLLSVFDSFDFAVSRVLNPVWTFVGSVRVAAQTLYGYAVKAPFRLLVYDS